MSHVTLLAVSCFILVGCSSIDVSASLPSATHSAEEIRANCSSFTNIDGCEIVEGNEITLQGVLYYPDIDSFHPKLYPLGEDILEYDLDKDADIPDAFPLYIYPSAEVYRRNLRQFHGRTVAVKGKAETNCAVVNFKTGGAGIDDEGNIWMISGYCHTQTDVYLTNFKVTALEDTQ